MADREEGLIVGHFKDQMIREHEQGWTSVADALAVCEDCVAEPAFKRWIALHYVRLLACSYCGSSSRVVSVNELFAFINDEWLSARYGEAVDSLPWDGREGGYQGTVFSSTDLVYDHSFFENAALTETFIQAFGEREFTPREDGYDADRT